ncbi:unnamed protein product [Caenorhabditis auriculariae]|uniref:Uncharacterized protein n=1 Tax=Caenorhabditis auriculariae TaxID=2777116 RepID=A0A8S1GWY7_9PELO|nr:unnamed protein product [Caenorhabditis auriculariae]
MVGKKDAFASRPTVHLQVRLRLVCLCAGLALPGRAACLPKESCPITVLYIGKTIKRGRRKEQTHQTYGAEIGYSYDGAADLRRFGEPKHRLEADDICGDPQRLLFSEAPNIVQPKSVQSSPECTKVH